MKTGTNLVTAAKAQCREIALVDADAAVAAGKPVLTPSLPSFE